MKTAEQFVKDTFAYDLLSESGSPKEGLSELSRAMREYAQQFIDEAANLVDGWENSGSFREGLLEELNPQNK